MISRMLALLWGGVASVCLSSMASGQIAIGVNTVVDAADYNLPDGVCDCDSVTPGPQCSLRAALQNANLLGGWVIVQLGPNIYNLTFGGTDDLCVAGDLDIYAPILTRLEINGPAGAVISAAGLAGGGTPDRILHITGTVANNCDILLNNVTIQDGAGVAFGAGLHHQGGRVRLTNVWFVNCTANDSGGGVRTLAAQQFIQTGGGYDDCDAALNGGGVMLESAPAANVAFNGVSFVNCDASTNGGGVRVAANAVASISNCTVGSNNGSASGGGISNRGTLTVVDSSIAANFASGTGGGVANNIGGTLTMNRCTLVQNQANIGGGLNNSSGATLADCTIRLNNADTAGGISNTASAAAPLRLYSSAVLFNFATSAVIGGGGYRGFGAMEMINCTFSGNAAQNGRGGGIYFDGGLQTVDINSSTISNNFAALAGGGLFTDNSLGVSPIRFRSCILANNNSSGVNSNFGGTFPLTSQGFNLDSDGTCLFAAPGDLSNVPAMLGPLQNNGGPTDTRALMAGSPAINSGACTTIAGNAITHDQRGFVRVAPCDMGAFEANALPPPPNDLCSMAANVGPGSFPFTNVNANTDGPPTALPCGFTGLPGQDSDVWFRFVSPCSATVTISVTPSLPVNPARILAIYDTCPVIGAGPPPIACASGAGGAPAVATVIAVAGQTFIIRAGSPGGNQGTSILDITVNCACPADVDGNNSVTVTDLLAVINGWGACPAPCPPHCAADIAPVGPPQGNCVVDVVDLLLVINNWGPCP